MLFVLHFLLCFSYHVMSLAYPDRIQIHFKKVWTTKKHNIVKSDPSHISMWFEKWFSQMHFGLDSMASQIGLSLASLATLQTMTMSNPEKQKCIRVAEQNPCWALSSRVAELLHRLHCLVRQRSSAQRLDIWSLVNNEQSVLKIWFEEQILAVLSVFSFDSFLWKAAKTKWDPPQWVPFKSDSCRLIPCIFWPFVSTGAIAYVCAWQAGHFNSCFALGNI